MKFQRWARLLSLPKSTSQWKALICGAFVLAAFGAKLWIISSYGNPTPLMDEWDAQAANLFIPYFDSTLSLQHLLAPHNEHRLLTTRVVSLLLIAANGLWDPVLQMIVNAAIHVALGACILIIFGKHLDRYAFVALTIITVTLVAVPNASESPLTAIQTHFYCVLLFGFIAINLVTRDVGFSAHRVLGIIAATLSFLSLASGALVFLACAGVVITKRFLGVARGWREGAFVAVLLACFILAVLVTPVVEGHKVLRAHTIRDFIWAFSTLAGWPLRFHVVVAAFLVNAPLVVFAWLSLRKPPSNNSIAWVLLAFGLWNGLQFAALAFGRTAGIAAPRYLDICAMGLIVNFVCAATISDTGRKKLLVAGWVAAIAIGWIVQTTKYVPQELQYRYSTAVQQENNVKAFLATGEFLPGASGDDLSLPYPDAKRLAALLSDARVRRFLPSNLQTAIADERLPGEASVKRDRLGGVRSTLLLAGPYCAVAGLLLLFLLVLRTPGVSTNSATTRPET